MTKEHIIRAIEDCNAGLVAFNRDELHSFLYGKKWYPIRRVVNYATELANEHTNWNLHQAYLNLNLLVPYLKIGEIRYESNFPIEISDSEIIDEVKSLTDALNRLVSN